MNNSKFHKIAVVAMAVMIVSAGCGQVADTGEANNSSKPPIVDGSQNGQQNSQDGQKDQQDKDEVENGKDEGTDNTSPSADINAKDIYNKITTEIEMSAFMELQPDQVEDVYGLAPENIGEGSIFMLPMMNIRTSEISIVRLKSEDDFDIVKSAMEQRAANIQKTFETYLQDQYELSKKYQIVRNGEYVMFSITPDQEKAAEIFNSFFAK